MSQLREEVFKSMERYVDWLKPDFKDWKILEVGIAGDEKPSGNYKYFGTGNKWKTLDYLPQLQPDFVADITDTKMPSEEWDLIICSQTLEHVFHFQKAINEIFRMLKVEGCAILDCPFEYPYHGEDGFDDYWRMTDTALVKCAREAGFGVLDYGMVGPLTTGLFKKV
jgi:SAM-dependent methyltransferase